MSAAVPTVGSLTDRVQLRKKQMIAEDGGGHTALFVPLTSLWARVRALSARQLGEADGRGVSISHSVVVRFRTDVTPGDRFVHRGRQLEVVGIEDLNGRRVWLGCQCVETGVVG